jgi:hypothetical protein
MSDQKVSISELMEEEAESVARHSEIPKDNVGVG